MNRLQVICEAYDMAKPQVLTEAYPEDFTFGVPDLPGKYAKPLNLGVGPTVRAANLDIYGTPDPTLGDRLALAAREAPGKIKAGLAAGKSKAIAGAKSGLDKLVGYKDIDQTEMDHLAGLDSKSPILRKYHQWRADKIANTKEKFNKRIDDEYNKIMTDRAAKGVEDADFYRGEVQRLMKEYEKRKAEGASEAELQSLKTAIDDSYDEKLAGQKLATDANRNIGGEELKNELRGKIAAERKASAMKGAGIGAMAGGALGAGAGGWAGKRLLLGKGEVRAAIKDAIVSSKSPSDAASKLAGLNSKKALAYAEIIKQNAKDPNWKNKVLRKMAVNSALATGGGSLVGGALGAAAGTRAGAEIGTALYDNA